MSYHDLTLIHVGQLVIGECSCKRWGDRKAHRLTEAAYHAEDFIRKEFKQHLQKVGAPLPEPEPLATVAATLASPPPQEPEPSPPPVPEPEPEPEPVPVPAKRVNPGKPLPIKKRAAR